MPADMDDTRQVPIARPTLTSICSGLTTLADRPSQNNLAKLKVRRENARGWAFALAILVISIVGISTQLSRERHESSPTIGDAMSAASTQSVASASDGLGPSQRTNAVILGSPPLEQTDDSRSADDGREQLRLALMHAETVYLQAKAEYEADYERWERQRDFQMLNAGRFGAQGISMPSATMPDFQLRMRMELALQAYLELKQRLEQSE